MTTLRKRLDDLEQPVPGLPRLFLLESEYMAAVVRAQIQWLRAVTADLRSGRLTWDRAWLQRFAGEWAARSTDAQPTKPARRLRDDGKYSEPARSRGRRARRR